MGYPRDAKGYLVWFPQSKTVHVQRDIVFHGMLKVAIPIEPSQLWEDVVSNLEQQFQDPMPNSLVPMEGVEPSGAPMQSTMSLAVMPSATEEASM